MLSLAEDLISVCLLNILMLSVCLINILILFVCLLNILMSFPAQVKWFEQQRELRRVKRDVPIEQHVKKRDFGDGPDPVKLL